MADLEDLGLIHSPHTSAGRIPTPKGYRLFADRLLAVQRFPTLPSQMRQTLPAAEPGRAVRAAPTLLSNLSQLAGAVLAPKPAQVLRQIEFIRRSDNRVLLLIVTPDGAVQNSLLYVGHDYLAQKQIEE